MDLPLGWPHTVSVDEEIPCRPCIQARPAPVEPKLTGMVIGETVIDEVSGVEKLQATAAWKADEEEALKDFNRFGKVFSLLLFA